MFYKNLQFPTPKARPFFFTNFVTTLDGKVQVLTDQKAYWPIGSKFDYEVLLELRAHSDVLVHGANTALWHRHIESLGKPEFKKLRKTLGRKKDLLYVVISGHPDDKLIDVLKDSPVQKPILVTTTSATVSNELEKYVTLLRFGDKSVDLHTLSDYLFKNNLRTILVEGGPTLLGSFFHEDLIDEVFLTLAPKIFGNQKGETLTLVEGHLFPPDKIKKLKLLSSTAVEDELFLRYKVL